MVCEILVLVFFVTSFLAGLIALDYYDKIEALKHALKEAESWEAFYEDWVKIIGKNS